MNETRECLIILRKRWEDEIARLDNNAAVFAKNKRYSEAAETNLRSKTIERCLGEIKAVIGDAP